MSLNVIFWLIYLSLLAVLFPHTAWAFSRFEPATKMGTATAWAAAFAFEAAIAALTHRLTKHLETTPRYTSGRVAFRKFAYRYFNSYSLGLMVAVFISALANFAHAVEYSQGLEIFGQTSVSLTVYSVAFGGILPLVSLLFARVLSSVTETEVEQNEDLVAAKRAEREAKRELGTVRKQLDQSEQRFAALGDLFVRLMSESKRDRILAAREWRPALPASAVAIIAESSPSYVSEVLAETVK